MENLADVGIILIEDNPFDTELILKALQPQGLAHRVRAFSDGVEALDFLWGEVQESESGDKPGYCPKVIFLDLKLPKMNGLEVLSRLKGNPRTRLIPVVMLTSSREESDIKASYHLGANSYMVKPMDYDEFARAMLDLGSYWLKRNIVITC